MPDHIGAFLKASQCFSALGINITRVSYNKAVDSHTLFIDAEGTEEQLKKADYIVVNEILIAANPELTNAIIPMGVTYISDALFYENKNFI